MDARHILKARRNVKKLSQERLADAMTEIAQRWPTPRSWGRTDVNKREKGRVGMDEEFSRAAATALGCSVGDLFERPPDTEEAILKRIEKVLKRVPPARQGDAVDMVETILEKYAAQ